MFHSPIGLIAFFDGQRLSTLFSGYVFDPGFSGGVRVAAIDINKDKIVEVFVAPGPGLPGEVRAFDTATHAQVLDIQAFPEFSGGVFVG